MNKQPQPRTLISIALPLEMAAVLNKKARHHVSDELTHRLDWIGPERYHIMLHDLGHVPQDQHPDVLEKLTQVCKQYHPFHAMTGSCQFLPDYRQPDTLAALVHSGGYLQQLRHHIIDHTQYSAQECQKTYRPYITLARLDPMQASLYRPEWILPSIELNIRQLCITLSGTDNNPVHVIEQIALGHTG